jgi:3-methyladenine DNA glycosylase AlkD
MQAVRAGDSPHYRVLVSKTAAYEDYHREVVEALRAIGNPELGKAIQRDRGSGLSHLGIRFPALRSRVRQGFTFYGPDQSEVLEVWDNLWTMSPYGDVLFAALEYYTPLVRRQAPPDLWPVVRHWATRVDNWCHSDMLSAIYSRILAAQPGEVFPVLGEWNVSEALWPRRISLTSLVHYTGKNAVFLSPAEVLPLVSGCLGDDRRYIALAIGWVLREMAHAFPEEITAYLEANAATMNATAFSRAIERRGARERERLRALRTTALGR